MTRIAESVVAILLTTAAFGAEAQVHRCKPANGATVYQDEPCKGGRQLDADQLRANTLHAGPRLQALTSEPNSGPPAAVVGAGTRCPTAQEIRNVETTASSNAIRVLPTERRFLLEEIDRARACRRTHRYTEKDWRDIWTLHSFQTRMDPADRARARQEALGIHRRAGN
jgi:hypothetical protein